MEATAKIKYADRPDRQQTFRYSGEHTQIGCGSLKDFMGLHAHLNFSPI